MKLFFKILFSIFTMFITVGETQSFTIVNIVQKEILFSIFQESQPSIDIFENHFENSCLNGENIVAYSERVTSIDANKGGAKATESVIKGFTQHGTNQAVTRGFKTADILKIVSEGNAVEAMDRFGVQTRYTLGGNTVVLNAQGKVISVFNNAPGTATD